MQFVLYFNVLTILIFCLLWIAIVSFLRLRKKKSFIYLLFFTVFYVYKVLDYTLLQFQSLLLLKYVMPHLMLHGASAGKSLNLFPLVTLTLDDVQTSLLNILLFIPFGFGLPFITNLRMKRIVVIGILFSIVIELLQLITGLLGKLTFRIADINDVIFNTVGVVLGYILFVRFVRICHHVFLTGKKSKNAILQFIINCPQIDLYE